jgi:hypothetical protein
VCAPFTTSYPARGLIVIEKPRPSDVLTCPRESAYSPPVLAREKSRRFPIKRPHRLEAQDTALSRRRRGFESRWGHSRSTPVVRPVPANRTGPTGGFSVPEIHLSRPGTAFQPFAIAPAALQKRFLLTSVTGLI